jgi:hypothetical protein
MTDATWFCHDCHTEQPATVPEWREPGWLDGDVICPACRAKWEAAHPGVSGVLVYCAFCNGKGGRDGSCRNCDGTGMVPE